MKLFLRSVLYFEFYWVEKFDALKKRSKGSRRRTDPSNKYPTCLKTVRREHIVRLFAQTSLHTVGSARRTSSTHKSMEMYVGVEQALAYRQDLSIAGPELSCPLSNKRKKQRGQFNSVTRRSLESVPYTSSKSDKYC